MSLLVFPIHCFDTTFYKNLVTKYDVKEIIIWEHPVYFGDRRPEYKKPMRFHLWKLLLHKYTCQDLAKRLKTLTGVKVKHYQYPRTKSVPKAVLAKCKWVLDPVDHLIESQLGIDAGRQVLDHPGFLLSRADCDEYLKSIKYKPGSQTPLFHARFYKWQLARMKPTGVKKSYDTENRNAMPRDTQVPNTLIAPQKRSPSIQKILSKLEKGLKGASGRLPGDPWVNWESPERPFRYPVDHKEAKTVLRGFLRERLGRFGDYQDAIDSRILDYGDPGRDTLFHSVISSSLNIGLLTPQEVFEETEAYFKNKKHQKEVKLPDFEGFIRQVIGWREYERLVYNTLGETMRRGNHFSLKGRLSRAWYEGKTGVLPLDQAIKSAFASGYLHHILRLMVMGNLMTLSEIAPDEVYRWMMEFSVDSYDWVMVGNVYGMATYADGGLTMRKPYLASSNYLLKMGNYNKTEEAEGGWPQVVKALYYRFLDKYEGKLKGTPYLRNLAYWKKLKSKEKDRLLALATNYFKQINRD